MTPRSFLLSATLLCALASPAVAYVGPGPGLSMVGSFFTLVASIAVALLMVLLLPMRILYKRMKARKILMAEPTGPAAPDETLPENK